jgi:hypothetical protein
MLQYIADHPDPLLPSRWELARRIDKAFASHATVSVENLYHRPQQITELLRRSFHLMIDPAFFAVTDPEVTYATATAKMVQRINDKQFFFKVGMFGFKIGQTYPIGKNTFGSLGLSAGWSDTEDSHAWTDGHGATLLLPLASNYLEFAPLTLRLDGWVVPGPWTAQIFVQGKPSMMVTKPAEEAREITMTVPLWQVDSLYKQPIIKIDLKFGNTICGLGGDPRQLSFALQSLSVEGNPAELATAVKDPGTPQKLSHLADIASLRPLIGRRTPRITIGAVGDDLQLLGELPQFLAAAGLTGLLILICDFGIRSVRGRFERSALGEGLRERPATNLETLTYHGTLEQVLTAPSVWSFKPDLLVLRGSHAFSQVIDSVAKWTGAELAALPDIMILTSDLAFWHPGFFWRNPVGYAEVIYPSTSVVGPNFVYFSH